jgi:photosystem II stability/assembly factor-like uncharacterized protein
MTLRRFAICLLFVVFPLSRAPLAAEELPSWKPIGPDGGNVQALAVSPALPDVILAGLGIGYSDGLFRSVDRGKSWSPAANVSDIIFDLAIDAQGRAVYATSERGFLKSTDGGVRWSVLDEAPGLYKLVAPHPRRAAIVFAIQPNGALVRSANGGVTRRVLAKPSGVRGLAFALSGERTVIYAAADHGLWRSTDDGRTWSSVSLPFPSPRPFSLHVEAVAVDPRDPRILYADVWHNGRFLLKSRDGGATWTLCQQGLRPSGDNADWPAVSKIAVDPRSSSIVYAVAGGELFRSVDGGGVWSRPVPRLPGDIVQDLETTRYGVLAGTPAGVLLSTDQGLTWQFRVAGMAATWIYGMAIDRQEPARLSVLSPTSAFKTASQGRPWLRLGDLESTLSIQGIAVDPENPAIVHALAAGGIVRSTNGGRRWNAPKSFPCVRIETIALDPRQPAHVFALGNLHLTFGCEISKICRLFRSLDAGESWQCAGADPTFSAPSILAVDPFTSALYAQDRGGRLMRSLDKGVTWTSLELVTGFWVGFAASPLVEGTLWVGLEGGVARSRDGGVSWHLYTAGLPAGGVGALALDPTSAMTLYAVTGSGVFKSIDAGETWSPAGLWPPGVLGLGGLLVDPDDPTIVYAGTAGGGVLRLDQNGSSGDR